MPALRLLLLLVLAWVPASAASFQKGPAAVPPIAAPLSAAPSFPVKTAGEFFSGAKTIVDLGGETIGPWTHGLAQGNPQAAIHAVNVKFYEKDIEVVRQLFKAPNMHGHQYDFFDPPKGHPVGDRVVFNSPNFGGFSLRQAEEVAKMADAHMKPGGLFYAQGDDLWFLSLTELKWLASQGLNASYSFEGRSMGVPSVQDAVEGRKALMLDAFKARFGRENVSERRLSGYDSAQKLNAADFHVIQVRKPL